MCNQSEVYGLEVLSCHKSTPCSHSTLPVGLGWFGWLVWLVGSLNLNEFVCGEEKCSNCREEIQTEMRGSLVIDTVAVKKIGGDAPTCVRTAQKMSQTTTSERIYLIFIFVSSLFLFLRTQQTTQMEKMMMFS
mgnify:CR=1 FL=1